MTASPHTFATITDADWRRELRARRAAMDSNHRLGTALLAKVRNRIAAQQSTFPPDTSEPANSNQGKRRPDGAHMRARV